ncbi:hypothetical protein BHE74_00015618 [Ensete ventricosum]|nr:hypothetical protein BHE74_00015618 [Ensete ventricosum]
MSGIRRLGALAARSLARRVFAPPHMHHRSFGAAALAEVEYWTEWEEDEERGRYAAAAATDACGEREPRRVQWVFMGSPGVQRHVYATRVAELLDVPYISMGSLVRQELNPSSSLYKKRVISSFSGNSCHCVALGFLELSVTKHLRTEGVEEEEIKARVSRPGWDPPLGSPRSTIPRPTGVRAAAYAPAVLGAAALAEVEYWTGWQEDPAAAAAATAPLAIRKDHFDHSFIGFASAILVATLHLQPSRDGWLPPSAMRGASPLRLHPCVRAGRPPPTCMGCPPLALGEHRRCRLLVRQGDSRGIGRWARGGTEGMAGDRLE